MKNISVPATSVVSLARDNFKKQTEEEYMWLEHARQEALFEALQVQKRPHLNAQLCVCVRGSAHKIKRTQTEQTLSLI